MDTTDLIRQVKQVALSSIRPSPDNPRGEIERNESFARLVSSVEDVGILVPLVVREFGDGSRSGYKYEIVDGERRYLASKELNLEKVPAHILPLNFAGSASGSVRKLMFHLHMTREQWGPMAQCRSLVEAYPKLSKGIAFTEKQAWCTRLARETGMSLVTARDRVHVLSWPGQLKERFFGFDDEQPKKNIYSYILAIEASIVESSVSAFPAYYNGGRPADIQANVVRARLLDKTIVGIETGVVTSREQIRGVTPLFETKLKPDQRREALHLFKDLVDKPAVYFDDIQAEITTRLPELVQEKPAKPTRVIAIMYSLSRTLSDYKPQYLESSSSAKTKKNVSEFRGALTELQHAINRFKEQL